MAGKIDFTDDVSGLWLCSRDCWGYENKFENGCKHAVRIPYADGNELDDKIYVCMGNIYVCCNVEECPHEIPMTVTKKAGKI